MVLLLINVRQRKSYEFSIPPYGYRAQQVEPAALTSNKRENRAILEVIEK